MVYELDDGGERIRLDITDESQIETLLHPDQVLVIVKEELRRIFIWKGSTSPVRKRFISSRVAQALQEELVKVAAFHRCKIISVDQGSEPVEFLNTFKLESMEVTETLADMLYVRNIDKQKMEDEGIIPEKAPKIIKVEKKKEEDKPMFEKLEESDVIALPTRKTKVVSKKPTPSRRKAFQPPAKKTQAAISGLSEILKTEIIERILKTEVPKNFKRQNLILGHTLYGAVSKQVNVFGKIIHETEWQPVKKVPNGIIEIDDHKIRVYLNEKKGIVEAIEVLKKEKNVEKKKTTPSKTEPAKLESSQNYNSWTVNKLKNYCIKNNIKLLAGAKKADIIKILEENLKKETNSKPSERRKLPKIPGSKD